MRPSPLRWETKFLSQVEMNRLFKERKLVPYVIYQIHKNEKLT